MNRGAPRWYILLWCLHLEWLGRLIWRAVGRGCDE